MSIMFFLLLPLLYAQKPMQPTPGFFQSVYSTSKHGSHIYTGGAVILAGPNGTNPMMISAVDGSMRTGLPVMDGVISTALPDGEGGWYVAGNFKQIGDYQRKGMARLLADGSVEPSWTPEIEGIVGCMQMYDGKLYIAGSFTGVNGVSRLNIACLNLADGSLVENWTPSVTRDRNPSVHTISIDEDHVYMGGYFTAVNGRPRSNLARISRQDGILDESWNPNPNYSVNVLLSEGAYLFAGGNFTQISQTDRSKLVKLQKSDGTAVSSWQIDVTMGSISRLQIRGDYLYAGGDFDYIGGGTYIPGSNLRRFALTDGTADESWDPDVKTDVHCMVIADDHLFVTAPGMIALKQQQSTNGAIPKESIIDDLIMLFKIDLINGARANGFNPPGVFGNIFSLAAGGNELIMGGWFVLTDPALYYGLSRFDAEAGELDRDWVPLLNRPVMSMLHEETYLLAGLWDAEFSINKKDNYAESPWYPGFGFKRNFESRKSVSQSVVKIDYESGLIDQTWGLGLSGSVFCLVADEGDLYAGGFFPDEMGGEQKALIKIDRASGEWLAEWDPGLRGGIMSVAIHQGYLYMAGQFFVEGLEGVQNLARLSLTDGSVDSSWVPAPDDAVFDLLFLDGHIYAGGAFTSIGGQPLKYMARLDLSDGTADNSWLPNPDGAVQRMACSRADIFAAGGFSVIGGESRKSIARLDTVTGQACTDWQLNIAFLVDDDEFDEYPMVHTIKVVDDALLVGGSFFYAGGFPAVGFARFELNPPAITTHPDPWQGCVGSEAIFSVQAETEAGPLTYQWQRSADGQEWFNMPERINRQLILSDLNADMDGELFRCLVSDRNAQVVSNSAELRVSPVYHFTESVDICEGEAFSWQGEDFSVAGTYFKHYTSIAGCDSVFELQLQILPSYFFTEEAAVCQGSVYNWQGVDYSEAGTYTREFSTLAGCDSIYELHLQVYPVYNIVFSDEICDGDVLVWQGNEYSGAGTYYANLESMHGCDSILVLQLSVYTVDNTLSRDGNTLTANASDAAYQWVDCNNNNQAIAGATGRVFTPTANGSYAVVVTQNECSSQSDCYEITTVGAFPPVRDTSARVYPIPNEGILKVELNQTVMHAGVQIFCMGGQLMLDFRNLAGAGFELDISILPKGIYVLVLSSDAGLQRFMIIRS